jgi:hypothetical protein
MLGGLMSFDDNRELYVLRGVASRIIKKQHNMTSPLLVVGMCAR